MKKLIVTLLVFIFASTTFAGQWSKLNPAMAAGGSMDASVFNLASANGKLYAATANGIFVSNSGNGGDWTNFGLQGKKVYLMNFDILQLALTIETAGDDATKKTLQLYKYNGSTWENTGFNPSRLKIFGDYPENLTSFTQLRNGDNVVIALPTWGNGIWISHNGGQAWSQVPMEDHPTNGYHFYRKIPGVFSFNGYNTIYALDKADFGMQYLSYSNDFGTTWQRKDVDNFFNPWALLKRRYNGTDYLYYGGENGEKGYIYRSDDEGANWEGSLTLGNGGLHNRRMLNDENGNLYIMAGIGDVYVSDDNGDSFELFGTGIIKPQTFNKFFLTHLINNDRKLFVSTDGDGIYSIDLNASGISNASVRNADFHFSPVDGCLNVSTNAGDKLQVYSTSGILMQQCIASAGKTKMDVRQFPGAVYILRIIQPNGEYKTGRFAIR